MLSSYGVLQKRCTDFFSGSNYKFKKEFGSANQLVYFPNKERVIEYLHLNVLEEREIIPPKNSKKNISSSEEDNFSNGTIMVPKELRDVTLEEIRNPDPHAKDNYAEVGIPVPFSEEDLDNFENEQEKETSSLAEAPEIKPFMPEKS